MAIAISGPYANRLRPCTRQITMPAAHHLIVCRPDALPDAQPTVSKHWRQYIVHFTSHHNHFTALFRDNPGEPVPEENFWTLWCKGRLTEANTPTIRLGATPSRLTSAHLHHPHILFYRPDALLAAQPTVSKHYILQHYTIVRFAVRMSSAF